MESQLMKRVKSYLWRSAMIGLVAMSAFGVENISDLDLPGWGVVLLGLGLGELSKWANNNMARFGRSFKNFTS